jgi:hypothetical protein
MFGIRAPSTTSPFYQDFWRALDFSLHVGKVAASAPVQLFPILKLVPERFAEWKRDTKKMRNMILGNMEKLLTPIMERMAKGEGNGCYMETVYERASEWEMEPDAIVYASIFALHSLPILTEIPFLSWFGSIMLDAGAETTSTFLANFVLLLAAYPDVAKKAQEEIDRIIGNDKLPEFDDYQRLPYLQAVVNEVRFHQALSGMGCL